MKGAMKKAVNTTKNTRLRERSKSSSTGSTKRKVIFELEQDSDGYPPFLTESVWATATDDPLEYIIDNIPFFARDTTLGDRVRVKRAGKELLFDAVVKRTSSSLIRVIMYDPGQVEEVQRALKRMGCSTEFFGSKPILAVSVPDAVDLRLVRGYLDPLESRDLLTYEEPIIRHNV